MSFALASSTTDEAVRLTVRIQGNRGRVDLIVDDVMEGSQIVDLLSGQVATLAHSDKKAEISTRAVDAKSGDTGPRVQMTPTGRRRQAIGVSCAEFRLAIYGVKLPIPDELPDEAREIVKSSTLTMVGVSWFAQSAPGAAEFSAFFRKSGESLESLAQVPVVLLARRVEGVSCVIETASSVKGSRRAREALEGSDGLPKLKNELLELSTSTIDDDVFRVPVDYEIVSPSAAPPRVRR
jgi:hypothetical protein